MSDDVANKQPVLIVLSSTYPRWAGDHEPGFVHELAKRLTEQFEVIAVVPSSPGALPKETLEGVRVLRYRYGPRRFETLVNDGGIVVNLKRHPWKWLLVIPFCVSQLCSAWRVIRRMAPTVIHAHWLLPQGVVAAMLRLLSRKTPPFVVTSHGADLFALRGSLFAAIRRFVVHRAAAVTVVSDAMRAQLVSLGTDASKISVQPMGVDLRERFTPDASVARSIDEILFVGRLVEKKGLRHLIDAMPQVLAKHPNSRLNVVGFGPEERALRTHTQALGLDPKNVRFLGAAKQPALPDMYRRAAIFAAPFVQAGSGDQEGLGLVLVEALGCGCPVIASELSATLDVLRGLSGCIGVPAGDSVALANAINRMLADLNEFTLRAAADRARIVDRFDWVTVSRRYANTLASVK